MAPHRQFRPSFRFGVFEVDPQGVELRRHGVPLKLHGKPFQVLLLLLERAGRIVSRQELRQHIWAADTFVDFDRNLNTTIKKLREALGDSADSPRYVETVPRTGYRFVAPVERLQTVQQESKRAAGSRLPVPPSLFVLGSRFANLRLAAFALVPIMALTIFTVRDAFLRPASTCQKPVSVAVLPFTDVGDNPGGPLFSAGLTEELTTYLGSLSGCRMKVTASRAVMKYRCSSKSIAEIGRELGVEYVLEGSVRRIGDRARVTAQLVRVSDQMQVLAETYDLRVEDSLEAQLEVARRVSRSLTDCLAPVQRAGLTAYGATEVSGFSKIRK